LGVALRSEQLLALSRFNIDIAFPDLYQVDQLAADLEVDIRSGILGTQIHFTIAHHQPPVFEALQIVKNKTDDGFAIG
jgi:hypothetical protein